uniref:Uncharacterized protein n=1 Tax=Anguilla anguilla TaxID=7936 RepID=A0A0E9WWE4_ANGAN
MQLEAVFYHSCQWSHYFIASLQLAFGCFCMNRSVDTAVYREYQTVTLENGYLYSSILKDIISDSVK